jgi:hypothetical protein
MVLSSTLEVTRCAATQELPCILWNPKVHYRIHKSYPLVPIMSHTNPVHIIPSYVSSSLILFIHLRLGLPSGIFLSGLPINNVYGFLFSLIRATCPVHLVVLDWSTLNYTWRRVQITKPLVMQFSPPSRRLKSLRSKYPPQHPVLKHPQCTFLP